MTGSQDLFFFAASPKKYLFGSVCRHIDSIWQGKCTQNLRTFRGTHKAQLYVYVYLCSGFCLFWRVLIKRALLVLVPNRLSTGDKLSFQLNLYRKILYRELTCIDMFCTMVSCICAILSDAVKRRKDQPFSDSSVEGTKVVIKTT